MQVYGFSPVSILKCFFHCHLMRKLLDTDDIDFQYIRENVALTFLSHLKI